MSRLRVSRLWAALLACAGCTAGSFESLDAEGLLRERAANRGVFAVPASSLAPAPLPGEAAWRLGPPAWGSLLDRLLRFNPDVRQALAAADAAARAASTGAAWPDPRLEGGPTATLGREKATGGFAGLGLEIPVGGRVSRTGDLLDAKAAAAVEDSRAAVLDRAFALRRAFCDVLASRAALACARESLEWAVRGSALARRIAQAGGASAVDVQILETEERAARLAVLEAEDRLEGDREALASLLALSASSLPPLPALPPALPAAARPDARALAALLPGANPELRRLKAAHEVAGRALDLERARRVPDFEVGVEAEAEPGGGTVFGIPLGFSLPLWDANREGVAAAKADLDAAREAFGAEADRALARLESGSARLLRLEERLRVLDGEILPAHRAALESARKAVAVSDFDPLRCVELERAQRLWMLARADLVREVLAARTDLEQAAGTPLFAMPGGG